MDAEHDPGSVLPSLRFAGHVVYLLWQWMLDIQYGILQHIIERSLARPSTFGGGYRGSCPWSLWSPSGGQWLQHSPLPRRPEEYLTEIYESASSTAPTAGSSSRALPGR